VGCNAIHRDFLPKHIVCCDRRMADEVVENQSTKNSIIYVRGNWFHYFRKIKKYKNIETVPPIPENKKSDHRNWGSGTYALLIGSQLSDIIYLVGFDLWPKNNQVNNIYKNTKNYSSSDSQGVDPNYWIDQARSIFISNIKKKFIVVNYNDWIMPNEWRVGNVYFQDFEEFNSLTLNNMSV